MAQHQHEYPMRATFLPGLDDYYTPSGPVGVVSPAPQRSNSEVPGQLQDRIQALELDSTEIRRPGPQVGARPQQPSQYQQPQQPLHNRQPHPGETPTLSIEPGVPQGATWPVTATGPGVPYSSPFPRIANRTSNVPPTHEEREAALEAARPSVLTSSDAEMQLYWAEDALVYADSCASYGENGDIDDGARSATPPIERQIRTDAVSVVNFLADQGHPKAEFLKGMWLEFGKFGCAQNKPEAFRAYKRAALKGYARAEYRMGLQYESTAEPMKALQHYKVGEAKGDSASCYRVGMMSLLGQLGQTLDFANGVRLVRYAADTADENAPQGAYVFGMMQAAELAQIRVPEAFLPIDLASARQYIEKAAFLGFAKAQLMMGSAYEVCSLGCPFDPVLALHYMSLAARQGEPDAEMAISKWFLCGYEGLFAKNNRLAYNYALRAASAGLPTAEFAMGYFFEVGIHVTTDVDKARGWYEKAAKDGNTDAAARLSALQQSNKLSRSDHEHVALNRIRSQYGSRRGQRPERFQKQIQPLQRITEQPATSMASQPQTTSTPSVRPQPPILTQPMSNQQLSTVSQPQHVPGRTAPYAVVERPATAAPYANNPNHQAQQGRPAANNAFPTDQTRPSSAAAGGRIPPMQQQSLGIPGSGPAPVPGPRPHGFANPQGKTLPTTASQPNLRQEPAPNAQRFASGGYRPDDLRIYHATPTQWQSPTRSHDRPGSVPVPGPPPSQNYGAMPHRKQTAPAPGPPQGAMPPRKQAAPTPGPPQVDIGFSAPIDPRADQRNRPTGAAGSRTNAALGTAAGPSKPQRMQQQPQQQGPAAARPSRQGVASAAAPPSGPSGASAAATAARPPRKGPQTFEEMDGVLPPKQDHDCIVM